MKHTPKEIYDIRNDLTAIACGGEGSRDNDAAFAAALLLILEEMGV